MKNDFNSPHQFALAFGPVKPSLPLFKLLKHIQDALLDNFPNLGFRKGRFLCF